MFNFNYNGLVYSMQIILLNMYFMNQSNFFLFFCLFDIYWAAPTAYGGFQARGQIRDVAGGLQQSHSNAGSQLHL